jgi:hypothetical protein
MRRALFMLVVVALLAGCGGGGGSEQLTAAQYRAKLAALGKEVETAHVSVDGAMKKETAASLADALGTFANAHDRIGDEVADLDPPADANAANEELAEGLHGIAEAVRDLVPKVRESASAAAAVALLERSEATAKAGQEVDHALAVLKKLGYTEGS